jgi:predicted ATPase
VPELKELIIGKTGGNPLFVEELTHSLLENGSIQRKDYQYVLSRKASDIQVPNTIHRLSLFVQILRLKPHTKPCMRLFCGHLKRLIIFFP